jgi:hypothetical protein
MRRLKRKQKERIDESVSLAERLFEIEGPATLPAVLEQLEDAPKRVKASRADLEARIFELEIAVTVRDNYSAKQRDAIQLQQEKLDIYERFLHDIEVHYMLTKDYRRVQELIDRACQWSQAHRNHYGDLGPIDRAAALELATRRLGGLV